MRSSPTDSAPRAVRNGTLQTGTRSISHPKSSQRSLPATSPTQASRGRDHGMRAVCGGTGQGGGPRSAETAAHQVRQPSARRSDSKPWLCVNELIRIRFATARSSTRCGSRIA